MLITCKLAPHSIHFFLIAAQSVQYKLLQLGHTRELLQGYT